MQNGFNNFSRLGPVNWQQGNTVVQIINAIAALAIRYSGATDTVTSIGLLDGPFLYKPDPNFLANVETFYGSGYGGPFAPKIPAHLLSSMALFKVLDTRRDIWDLRHYIAT